MASVHLFIVVSFIGLSLTASSFYDNERHQENIIEAVVQLSDWFKENHANFTTLEPHIASQMMMCLRLTGHQPTTLLSGYRINNFTVLDFLEDNLNKRVTTKPPGQLAYVYLGALSLCSKPKNDLTETFINELETFRQGDEQDFDNCFQYSVVVLAYCHSAEKVSNAVGRRIISQLTKVQQKLSSFTLPDTSAMAIMALSCLRQKIEVNEEVDSIISKYLSSIMYNSSSKKAWNIHSKSLTVQALRALAPYHDRLANQTQIKQFYKHLIQDILKQKDRTGSFGDVLANIQVLQALTGRSLVNLADLSCPLVKYTPVLETEKKKISVCIKLAFQQQASWNYYKQINFTVPEDTTALDLLKLAAQRNKAYQYEALKTSFGHMITAISGEKQDPTTGYFWLLYANENTMASNGVDNFTPKNNTCIIFRYQNVSMKNHNEMLAN